MTNQTTRFTATASPDFMLGEAWGAQAFDSSHGLFYMTYLDEEMAQICSLLEVSYGIEGAGLWTAVNRNGIVCYIWEEVVSGARDELISAAFEYLVPNREMTTIHQYG